MNRASKAITTSPSGKCNYRLWHEEPRPINEDTIREPFGDQLNMVMNRLGDETGYKPLVTGMG